MSTSKQSLLALHGHACGSQKEYGIFSWLSKNKHEFGERPALSGLNGGHLNHTELFRCISENASAILRSGLGRNSVVLIALPNDPAALSAILSVAAVTTAFPVMPDESGDQLECILHTLPVRAVIFNIARPGRWAEICAQYGLIPFAIDIAAADRLERCIEIVSFDNKLKETTPTNIDDAAILTRTAGTT